MTVSQDTMLARDTYAGVRRARAAASIRAWVAVALVASIVLAGLAGCAPPGPGKTPVRIMLVGDSITQGSTGDYTWRYRLWQHLHADRVDFQFVGPQHKLWNDVGTGLQHYIFNSHYADPAFAADAAANAHDAIAGEELENVAASIGSAVRRYRPNYVIVLLGINDLLMDHPPAIVAEALRTFIDNARAASARLRFDVLKLPPAALVDPSALAAYNQLVGEVSAELSTSTSPIVVTDPPPDYSADAAACTDTWDGIHPNARGEVKIAAAVADTLHTEFHLGALYPRRLPAMRIGSQPPRDLTVKPTGGGAELKWAASLGATQYWIWRRAVGQPWIRPFPLPIPGTQTSFRDGLLTSGLRYQYRLQAAKGTCTGGFSNIADVTPHA